MNRAAHDTIRRTLDAVWRMESSRLLGALLRLTGDLDCAADLAQTAFVKALETWPATGVPDNPGAWLLTTARNHGLDRRRHQKVQERKAPDLKAAAPESPEDAWLDQLDAPVHDDVLRLMLVACHPILSGEARVALTLRMVAGLTTGEIARAFLIAETTAAHRIVRAKRALAAAGGPFELPRGEALAARLPAVLQTVYLVFNEGHAPSSGSRVVHWALCEEALRLGRVVVGLVPDHAEARGLLALMELTAARVPARRGADGLPVLLEHQDRGRWDRVLLRRGLAELDRAMALGRPFGPYVLQASVAACHGRARCFEDTDWQTVLACYDALAGRTGSPVVELNRAMAMAMTGAVEEALALVDALALDPSLARYPWLPSVRGDLLVRLERFSEARVELLRAAEATESERDRRMLRKRVAFCEEKLLR